MEVNSSSDEDVMKRIESFIFDENKIVTYKWLSRTINIHPDVAKEYLSQFFQERKKRAPDISACFVVGGISKKDYKDAKVHKICIVAEDDIGKAKQMFQQVTCEHIYGVQQGSTCDLKNLYAADYAPCDVLLTHLSKWKIIQCENARRRTEEEMRKLKIPVRSTTSQRTPLQVTKASTSSSANNAKTTSAPSSDEKKDSEGLNTAKAKIPSMFLKQSTTKKPTVAKEIKKEQDNNSEKPKTSSNAIKKGSMMSYFTKGENKPKNTVASEIPQERTDGTLKTSKQKEDTGKEPPKSKSTFNTPTDEKKQSASKNTNTDSSGSNDFQKPQKTSKPQGKHKRIYTMSSSESESEEEEMESESPFPPGPSLDEPEEEPMETDSEEPIPPTPPVLKVSTHRKQVTETYEDEDGFLVTKTVWKNVTEVETEPESQTSTTTTTPDNTSKGDKGKKHSQKVSPPSGGKKQASLMSFFMKKETQK